MKPALTLVCLIVLFCMSSGICAVSSYEGDEVIGRLLATPLSDNNVQKKDHLTECEAAASKYSQSKSCPELYSHIGDVYYGMNQIRYASQWRKWYLKAVKANASLETTTPIGFRLQQYSNIALKKKLMIAVYVLYSIILLILILHTAINFRFFRPPVFLKKGIYYLALFGIAAGIVFVLDSHQFRRNTESIAGEHAISTAFFRTASPFVKPWVPFSVLNGPTNRSSLLILLFGFIPIGLAVYYSSFSRTYSRGVLAALVLCTAASLWTHFTLIRCFDDEMQPKAALTQTHIIFKGEIRDLLKKNPQLVLQANPNFLQSDNTDLKEYLEKKFPHGFPPPGSGKKQ